ncbi:MAG: hypothetical protein BV457_00205 [Thermoplasmata archaeon M9B1D]|nr:MAG: hypothetical protein BV457_00205 [Thermoplasmata archaeon M9B1D]PNX52213.1 MAG: hypothetical protein BV456_00090 [Thermoplasmata archaeon M8B2D]
MSTKKLNELDGNLASVSLGAEIEGDGVTPLSAGYYVITAVGSPSGLPTNAEAGYPFYSDTGITPETGDKVKPMTFTNLCDVQNASLEFAKDEIEDTTICDRVKTYKFGRSDITGTIEGVMTVGLTDLANSFMNKVIDIVSQSADLSTLIISKIDNTKIYLQLEVNKESINDEPTSFYLLPVVLGGFSAGISQGEAQTFSSNFRIVEDDEVKPSYFKLSQPVV